MSELVEYKGYYAVVEFNAEDKVFHGKLIGINDLVNFEGASVNSLVNDSMNLLFNDVIFCRML